MYIVLQEKRGAFYRGVWSSIDGYSGLKTNHRGTDSPADTIENWRPLLVIHDAFLSSVIAEVR